MGRSWDSEHRIWGIPADRRVRAAPRKSRHSSVCFWDFYSLPGFFYKQLENFTPTLRSRQCHEVRL